MHLVRDVDWMNQALAEARAALEHDDVPVGAVVVHDGEVIARAHNRREVDRDPVAHAETLALRQAAQKLGRWRLSGCTIYVSLEPCSMCAGALVLARVDRLVYGALDLRTGACGSIYDIVRDPRFNHRLKVREGLLKEPASKLLSDFFATRRQSAASRTRDS